MKAMRSLVASHVDYGDFVGLIPQNPNFCPSDLDGIAERNGHFLIMEWKRPGEKMNEGQKRLLQALAANPKFMVVVIIGNTDNGTNIQEYWQYAADGKAFKAGVGFDSFKTFYRLWYDYADGNKR
jgi:enoyl-CoA hydratase/carnithine racemase